MKGIFSLAIYKKKRLSATCASGHRLNIRKHFSHFHMFEVHIAMHTFSCSLHCALRVVSSKCGTCVSMSIAYNQNNHVLAQKNKAHIFVCSLLFLFVSSI